MEREIAALGAPAPYKCEYEDVLEYYGQSRDLEEAWPTQAAQEVPFTWDCQDEYDFWLETPDYITGWDPSLGPVEITSDEIADRLSKKDLDQFEDDEIVTTVERRGMIIGFKKDGSSCILKNGKCA